MADRRGGRLGSRDPHLLQERPGSERRGWLGGHGRIALAPDGSAIVWIEDGQAPYRSTDTGSSWSRVGGLGTDAVVIADRSSAKTFYSLSGGTLHASGDGGATFTARAVSLPDGPLTAVTGVAGDLWIASSAKGCRTPPTVAVPSPR